MKEYIYGKNQEIKVEGDSTILSCKMQYRDKIIKFVLLNKSNFNRSSPFI